ncbi:TPA: hydrogenase assembly protein HupF [Candidatus Sumerlaeota bacterium]|jgi:hydrogenase expression/formation protein HypC|nr:hydrogenase assembly protein HupF [Candidatus Sumerlaeota bacterium]
MCLAVPGKIVEIFPVEDAGARIAKVDFQGSRLEVSLQMTPEAVEGNWVLVHAGFALHIVDESEAREIWECLNLVRDEMEPVQDA